MVLYALASTDTRGASTSGSVVLNVLYDVKRLSKPRSLFLYASCVLMSSETTPQQSGDEDNSEEMSLLSIQPPAVFLDCPGEPKIPFTAWKGYFDNYLLAIGGDAFPAARKRALPIHCLGTEGQRIYNTLPLETDDYGGSVSALEKYFEPKLNVVAERYRFRQRAQAVGESTDHYVASLRELVKKCKFGTFENEMLRDQIVEKTNSTRIRERLLMEEDLTLDRALALARRTEAAIADAKAISVADTKPLPPFKFKRRRANHNTKAHRKWMELCYATVVVRLITKLTINPALLRTVNVTHVGRLGTILVSVNHLNSLLMK